MRNKLIPQKKTTTWIQTMIWCSIFTFAGCQSPQHRTTAVGPSLEPQKVVLAGTKKRPQYKYNSNIYLNVAVPIFDPGIPQKQDKIKEEGIWPQLRRAEANRFALQTRQALQDTQLFSSVNVVPSAQATADLYVLGTINKSDSQDVEIYIEVKDISGKRWGRKTFKHDVSEGFYRDKRNKGKDSYQPVFDKIARYVYKLLKHKSEKEKTRLQQITFLRFASVFSPETYSKYLSTNRKGRVYLNGLPSDNDPMTKRINAIRLQDQLFIERLQLQYEAFSSKTDDSYHTWQQKTLPVVIAAEKSERKALFGKILGGLAIVAGAVASKNNSSAGRQILTTAAIIGGGLMIKNGFGNSAEAKVQRATIDEMGESLDIEMDPQVMKLEDKTVELTGTATEQYRQWRGHLKKIYDIETTTNNPVKVENNVNNSTNGEDIENN